MKGNIIRLKNKLLDFFNVGQVIRKSRVEQEEFFHQVKKAHREWQIALNNYNFCEEQDFIDYSIYNIRAKEEHFIYLIKRARKEKIMLELNINEDNVIKSYDN